MADPRLADAQALVLGRVQKLTAELVARAEDARADQADGVHKTRVTSRRLRSVLRSFGPLLSDERIAPLTAELRWLAGVLGSVRDAEVLIARLSRDVAALSERDSLGAAQLLLDELSTQRRQAHAVLLETLDSCRYTGLLAALAELAGSGRRPSGGQMDGQSADALMECVAGDFRRVRRRARRLARRPDDERSEAWHDLRKAVKRLRYAAEVVAPIAGKKGKRLLEATTRVQRCLGDRHDAQVSLDMLRERSRQASVRMGDNGYVYGVLAANELARIARAEAEFDAAWPGLARKRNRRWLS